MVQATAGGTILSSFCWSFGSVFLVVVQLLIMYIADALPSRLGISESARARFALSPALRARAGT